MAEPFTSFSSALIPLPAENVDTDQIIPARFLKTTEKSGLADALFYDWRYDAEGQPRPDFIINQPAMQGRQVLLAGDNFGAGSSREHAPWALEANGINLVVGEIYARIFRQNMFNCGMLAIELPKEQVDKLFALEQGSGGVDIAINLAEQKIVARGNGHEEKCSFELSPFDKALVEAGGWVEYADARY